MNKKIVNSLLFACASGLVLAGTLLTTKTTVNPSADAYNKKEGKEEAQEIAGYLKYMEARNADPATGKINLEAMIASKQSIKEVTSNAKGVRAFPALDWKERGPNDVGGRARAVLVDKNNTSKLYCATAGGGLFISTNNGDTWKVHPQSDTFSSLQGSGLAQSINGDIYYATGEYSFGGSSGVLNEGASALPGDGIFKSTDGGVTLKQ